MTPLIASRTRPTLGDPDRSFVYLHSRSGGLSNVYTLTPASGPAIKVPRSTLAAVDLPWDADLHGCLRLSGNTPPGNYQLDAGRGPELTIAVQTAPARKAATVNPAMPLALVSDYLNKYGVNDVTFAPGLYPFTQAINLPDTCRVRGFGAVIQRTRDNPIGDKFPCFVANRDASIYGLTFLDCPAGGVLYNNNPASDGLVVGNCKFDGCNLGFNHWRAFVRNNHFHRGGAVIAPSGLWYQNLYTGPSNQDAWQGWYAPGQTWQIIEDVYRGTQRGTVFNAGLPLADVLLHSVEYHGICRNNNDGEVILCEGGALDRLVTLHCRVKDCDSETFRFDRGSADSLARDFVQDGGIGVVLNPAAGSTITNFILQDAELRRCGLYLGPGVVNPSFPGTRMIGFQPTRGGQSFDNLSPLCGTRTGAILVADPANMAAVADLPVVGLAAGLSAVQATVAT